MRTALRRGVLLVIAAVAVAAAAPAFASAAPPAGVTAIAFDGKVELNWQPAAGATAYNVYRGLTPSTITTQVTPTGGVITSGFSDTGAVNGTTYYYAARAVIAGSESANSVTVQAAPAARSCSAGNAVVLENCYPGTSAWNTGTALSLAGGGIEGFATASSVNRGSSFDVKLQTAVATTASIEIYRGGYYGGAGGRLMSVIRDVPVGSQPACTSTASTGLYDCSNWSSSATITTSSSWPSGVYLLRLVRGDNGLDYEFPVVVRNDSSTSAVLYGVPFTTYQAYNNYGGKSLYGYNSTGADTVANSPRAVKVSFNRPYVQPRDTTIPNWYARADYPMIAWLERSGYDVTYSGSDDLESNPTWARNHKAFISGAHDEYWSANMRSALQSARDAKVNLFFAGANAIFWKVRFENGGRTLVCYKTTESGAADPVSPTTLWRDPNGANQPENALIGQMYTGDQDSSFYPLVVSAAEGADRVWRYTGLDAPSNGVSTSIGTQLVGWEWDKRFANGFEPSGVKTLATSPVTGNILNAPTGGYIVGTTASHVTRYVAASGALVFGTGTNHWARGLALTAAGQGEPDLRIRQATTNVLEDMGVAPATPAADITLDSSTAPQVVSTSPADGGTAPTTTPVTATFSAAMNASTITATSFTLKRPDGTTVPASVSYDSGTLKATLTPSASLVSGTTYTARIDASVTSATGTPLQSAVSWTFTTAAFYVTSTVPADGAQSTLQDTDVSATFSAAVDTATLTTSSFWLTDSTGATVAATLAYNATTKTATLQPNATLSPGGLYSAHVASSVKATDGTPLPAPVTWSFRTNSCPCSLFASDPAPELVHLSTANGRSGGPWSLELGAKIRVDAPTRLSAVRFYKDTLETGSHIARLWNASGQVITQISFVAETASGWQRQTFPAPPLLQPGVVYTVSVNANANFVQTFGALAAQIDSGPLHSVADGQNGVYGDAAGTFPTQSYNSSSYFVDPEVVPDGEFLPIAVASTAPTAANGISPDVRVRATFTRSVDSITLTPANFSITAPDSTMVPATIAYDDATLTARLVPSSPLALGTTYTVHLTTGIKSTTGSPLSAPVTFSFTTAATAPPPLTVDSTLPAAGASDIGATVQPRAHFSKPLDTFSLNAAAFTLTGPAGAVPANVSYDAVSQNATLVPQAPLTLGATYTAHVADTVEATDGSRVTGGYSWSFTVAATSPGAPTVATTSPANGATSVALAASLSATFSISLDPSSISGATFTANRTDGAGTVTGTVGYNAATRTAQLVPTSPFAPTADYFARIDGAVKAADGTPMGTAFGWSFSTTSCPCAFYFDSDTPSLSGLSTVNGDGHGSTTLELGVKIAVDEPMLITAFRFYKSAGETGTHVGRLWTAGGVQLAQQTFGTETASGWQQQALTTPVELLPGAVYVVSVNANEYFVQTLDALNSSIISGPLRTVPDGANAVYGSAAGTFPNQTFRTSSYYIDLQAMVEGTPAAPTVNATVPLAGATGVSSTATVRATFSRPMLPTKIDALAYTLTKVSDGTNVSGAITYDDSTNTAILTPSTSLATGESYTARMSTAAKARDGVPLAAPVTWTFTVGSPPTVTAKSPADGATGVARNATVQVTFSRPLDTTTLSGITLSGPSGAISTAASYNAATNTVTLTPAALLAVSTTFTANVATTVKAADGSAVASQVTWSFTTTADGTAPTTTITSGPSGTVSSTSPQFSFSASETGSSFECALDLGSWGACTSPRSYSGLSAGTHVFYVRATDPAGNTGAAATRTWTIDNSPPGGGTGDGGGEGGGSTPFVTSGPSGYTGSTTATFEFSANEPATFTCNLDGTSGLCTSPQTYTGLSAGAHTFTITATDGAGNTSAPESHPWTIDLTAPSTTASCNSAACSTGWYTSSPVSVTLAATDSASGVDHILYSTDGSAPSLAYSGAISVAATTTVRYAAVDHVGNVEATKSQLVQIDTSVPTAPTLAFSAFSNASATTSTVYFRPGVAGGFTVVGSSIDAQSGVSSYGYASLGTGWSGSGGVYTFTSSAIDPVEPLNVTATNGAGLTSAATSFTVTPDSGAPTSTAQCNGTACSAGWYTSSPVSVSLTATDSASGVDRILYSTDGSAPTTVYTGAISIGATSTVRFATVDKVGNVEATRSQLVQVDTTSPTAPTLAFSGFTNASATGSTVYFRPGAAGGVTVTGSSTDAQSGIASYAYPSLGGGWSGTGGVYSFTAAAVDPVEPLNVTATNGAGLASAATPFTVTPDSTAPVSSAQCNGDVCSAGWYTSAPVSVSLAATDAASGVAQIRYTTDGSDPSPINGTTYAGAFGVGATTTVKYRAYDKVGNEEAVGSLLVRVDTTAPSAPSLTFSAFANASATGSTVYYRSGVGGGFTVTGSSTDAESGVASYGYPSLGSGWSGTGGVYAFTPSAVDPAEPLNVTATNNASLTSAGTQLTVTPDDTAPATTEQCGGEACSAGWYTTSPVSVSLAATDSSSGVDRILYSTDGSVPSLTYSGAIAVATTTTIKFAAVDKVGNVESTHTRLVQVDTTAPTAPSLAFSGFTNASATGSTVYFRSGASGGFTVAGSSTDAESGVASYAYPGLGGGWSGSGAYTFDSTASDPAEPLNVTATNGAGLASAGTGFTVTPDASAPASTVVCNGGPCAAGWYSSSPVSVSLTASDSGSGVDRILYSTDGSAPSLTYSGAISLSSTATVRFAAVDKVGNVEATRSQLVQIDTDAPTAPALAFSGLTNASATGSTIYFRTGATGGFTVAGASTDSGSGVASYAYPSLGSGWSGAGAYSFGVSAADPTEPLNVTATDVAGNTSAGTGFTVTPDGSAPASTATCNGGPCSSGWYGASPVSVALAATDLGSGVDRILYSTDGSAPTTVYTGAISIAATSTVRFAAVDKVGNVEATGSQLVQIDTSAPSAPALTFGGFTNASASGSTVYFRSGASGGFTVSGSSTDAESGVASYAYPSLGSGWSGGGAYTFSAAAVDPAEPLDVTATNNAGLTSAATGFTVTPDGSAPATSVACGGGACASGWYASSPVSVSLAATDSGSGVDRILYSTDGSAPSLTYSGALAVATTTTIKFAAVDKVGNVEATHTQLVQIDTSAPSTPALTFSGFSNASATGSTVYFRSGSSGAFTVGASSTDAGSGVASYLFPSLGSGWSGSGTYAFDSSAADPAEPLNVTATDVAGNTSSAAGFTVTADGSAPASTVTCNGGACASGWYSSSPVSVALAATDSGSGVDRILYSTDGSAPSLTYSGALTVATTTTVKFAAVDKVGNVESTHAQLVQIDATAPTPPSLSFSAFTNAIASGSTVYYRPGASGGFTVTGSSTDGGSGVASYAYPSLGSGWSATGGAYSFTAAAVDPAEPLDVTATNNAGLTSTPTGFTVTPDASAPVTTASCGGGACSSGWYATSPVSVSLAATDTGSGVAQIRYTTDGTDPSPVNGSTYSGAFSVGATTTVKFRAYDNVGNEEAVGSQLVRIDTTAPSAPALSFSTLSNASATGSTVYYRPGAAGTFTVAGSSTDGDSGVASYAYPSLGSGWSGTGGAYSFTAAAADPAEPLNVTATDVAGNTSGTSGFTVTPDSTTPASTVVCGGEPCSAGWYGTSPVSVSLGATDSGAGVDRILYSTDGSAPSLTYSGALAIATTTTVKFAAVDKVGNVESTHTQLVQIDTSAPSAPALAFSAFTNASATGSTVYFRPGAAGGFTVAGSSTDAESGVASYAYPSLGSGWSGTSGSYSFTAAAGDPAEPLNVTATNNAGVTSSATAFTVTPDPSAPASTVSCGGGACSTGWYGTSPISVTLAATDSGSGVDRILYSTDGSAPSLTYSGALMVATTTTIRFAAVDKVGNVETAQSRLVQIDVTPPSAPALTFSGFTSASATGSTVYYRPGTAGGFTVGAASTDSQSGVASYAFPGLGGGWSNAAGAYSFSAAAVDPAEPLNVTATDAAGNVSGAAGFTATPDGAAPVTAVTCNGGSCSGGWYTAAPTISLSASDLGSGVSQIRYTTDGSDPTPLNGLTYMSAFTVSGTSTVKYRAYDNVGNEELVGSTLVRIDTTAPGTPALTLSESSPFEAITGSTLYYSPSGSNSGSFSVGATASDSESGIASVGFPSIAGLTGGGSDSTFPYQGDYSWSSGASASGSQTVTASNAAGLQSSASFTLTPDTQAPAGGSVSYADGFTASGTITVTTSDGTDGGSGLDTASRVLERQSAALTDGTCGSYGSWTSVSSPDTVANATCARYRLRISDRVANEATYTSTAVVKVDTGAPSAPALTLSESSPFEAITGSTLYYSPSGSHSGSFTVDATSSASSGITKIAFPALAGMTGGGDDTTSPYSGAYSWTSSATASGAQSVAATSGAGQTASSSFTVTPDTAAPTGQTAALVGGPWYTTTSISVTSGDGSDALAGLDASSRLLERTTAPLSAGACGTWSGTWTTVTSPDTGVTSGTCAKYRFSIADRVANRSTPVETAVAMVDTTPPAAPSLAFSGFSNASLTGSTVYFRTGAAGGFSVAVTASDPESGIAQTTLPALGSGWTLAGSAYTFTGAAVDPTEPNNVTARNNAGLSSAATAFTVTADGTGPTGGSVGYTDGYRTATSVALTLADGTDAGSGVDTATEQLQRAEATLSAGTCGAYGAYTTIATDPPLSTSDGTVTSAHCYTYRYVVVDKVGNSTTFTSSSVAKIDAIAPTATLTDPGANLRGTVTLTSTTADTGGSGVASVTYQRSPAGANTWTTIPAAWDTTSVADGLYDLRVVAVDAAGNTTNSAVVANRRVDNTAPTALLADPGANLRATVTLSSTSSDAGSGVASVTYQQSPAGANTWTTIPQAFDTTTVADGLYDLRVVVVDNAGNTGTSTVTGRRVDNTAPSATLNSPGATVYGTVTLTSTTSDSGSGVASVTYQRSPAGANTWTSMSSTWDTTTVVDGNYDLRVVATDVAGNVTNSATVTTRVDNTTPRVSSTTPVDGAGGFSVSGNVSATFSRGMDAATITTTSFTVAPTAGGANVAAAVTYDSASKSATLDPTASLAANTSYTAKLTTAVKASDGTPLGAQYTWTFSTGGTPPTVTSTSPASGATGVAVGSFVTATFSQAMDASTITTASFTLKDPGGNVVPATVTYDSATTTAKLTPSAALAGSTTYTARLETTIKSSAGLALSSPYSWSFTTASSAPTVTSVTPPDGQTGVDRTYKPTATFSVAMDASTITTSSFTLKDPGGSTVASTVSYNATTKTATVSPNKALNSLTTYTARLETTIKSATGLPLAAAYSWRFQTVAPRVTATYPTNSGGGSGSSAATSAPGTDSVVTEQGGTDAGSTDAATTDGAPSSGTGLPEISPWTPIEVTFSEPMDPATITSTSFQVLDSSGSPVATTIDYNPSTNTAIATPVALLKYGATYTVNVANTIAAPDGAPLEAPVTWQFTTTLLGLSVGIDSGADKYSYWVASNNGLFLPDQYFTGGIARTSTNPIANTTDQIVYQTTRDGVVTYSAKVPVGTYDMRLHFADTESTGIGQRVFSVDVTDTTASPDIKDLDIYKIAGPNAAYIVTIKNVTATPQTPVMGSITVKTIAGVGTPTIAAIELVPLPPSIASVTPANGATNVARTSTVKVQFAQPMDAASITNTSITLKDPSGNVFPASVAWNDVQKIATLSPAGSLAPGTVYTVTVDSSVKAFTGLRMGTPYTSTFKTK